ncbi:hypothetical protein C8F01DRAFT_1062588 [Mycena amicta]|nr:hypothetical protein C8F01DRAFT_1062588 [Mycena amicta]
MNPYAQGGWINTISASSGSTASDPVLYGALPYPNAPATSSTATAPTFLTFTFTPASGGGGSNSILNSIVTGPNGRAYFRVSTDSGSPSRTSVQNTQSEDVARVEWRTYPIFELRGVIQRSSTAQWLPLSSSRRYRNMSVRGRGYCWTPNGSYIELSESPANGTPQLLGRISQGEEGATILELTPEAIHLNLFEAAILATVFLLSGRNID